ncbi:uncharacterized protein, partial [Cherax quadricarinatus]|uniref:uncharacterized protein n=1 Tax=Cherax quadricarinatus TaxID=27406 RepID=UPI00387EA4F2
MSAVSAPVASVSATPSNVSLSWCRLTLRQCVEFCRGQNHTYYLWDLSSNCDCYDAASGAALSVGTVPPATSCSELYYEQHVFISGVYVIQPTTDEQIPVLCAVEGREICNGSVVHGAAGYVTLASDGVSPDTVTTLNQLSPYVTPVTAGVATKMVQISFSQKVIINGIYISSADASNYVSSYSLTYTYEDPLMTNMTGHSNYSYSATAYSSSATIVNTTVNIVQRLRPFVADSVTFYVENAVGSPLIKLDFFGCGFNATTEVLLPALYGPWGCYYWPMPNQSTIIKRGGGGGIVASTGTPYGTVFQMDDYSWWALGEGIPLGKAQNAQVCSTPSCALFTLLLNLTGTTIQCHNAANFTADITAAYANVAAGKVTYNCSQDAANVYYGMKTRLYKVYNAMCPDETSNLTALHYAYYQESVSQCYT